jgi:hypothetical protein
MKTEQAIELARDFARRQQYDVASYDTKATRRGADWQIDFYPTGRDARPGDFFSVYFNERTPSSMRLVPGK